MNADVTGIGPTSGGTAPSPFDARRNAANSAFTQKLMSAAGYMDPSVVDAAANALRLKTGIVDPAALRSELFNSRTGQALLDAAVHSKHQGIWGNGSSFDAATNIAQTFLGGGFSANVVRQNGGRMDTLGVNQNIAGAGILSEHAAMRFQQSVMGGLSNSTNGFSRTDMTQVIQQVYGNGGLGNIATIQRDAPTAIRFASARDTSMPGVREQMTEFGKDRSKMQQLDEVVQKFRTLDKDAGSAAVQEYLGGVQDPKMRHTLAGVIKSTDAFIPDQGAAKKGIATAKAVAAGLAAVTELWPELQNVTEKLDRMQAVTGRTIVDERTAKAAAATMNQIIEATPDGVNATGYAQMILNRSAEFKGQFMQVAGLDGRSNSLATAAAAAISQNASLRAGRGSVYQSKVRANLAGMGVDIMARTEDELYEDERQGALTYINSRRGITALRGATGLGILGGEKAKQAQELMTRYNAATTAREEASISRQAEALLGGAKWFKSGVGEAALGAGAADEATMTAMRRVRMRDYDYSSLNGVTGSDSMSRSVVRSLGAGGLTDVMSLAKADGNNRDKIKDLLLRNKMSDSEATAFMDANLDGGGKLKDKESFERMAKLTQLTDRANASEHASQAIAEARLDAKGRGDYRTVIGNKGGGLRAIAAAMADGALGINADDAELQPLMIEALRKEGMGKLIKGGYESGIDMSKGVDDKALSQISKATGLDGADLARKAGYSGVGELQAATKASPQAQLAFREMLEKQTGFTVTGKRDGMNIMSDEASASLKSLNVGDKMKQLAAAEMMNPVLFAGEYDSLKKSIMDGKTNFNTSGFQASAFDKGMFGGAKTMDNLGRFVDLSKSINSASDDTLAGFSALDKDGSVLANLEKQRDEVRKALNAGEKTLTTYGSDGKTQQVEANELMIKAFDAAIAKLEKANGKADVGNMTVTTLQVNGKVEYKQETP